MRLSFIETDHPTAHRPQHIHRSRHTHGRAHDVNVSGSPTCVNSEANSTTSTQHKCRLQCLGQCEGAFGADVVPIEVQLFKRGVGLVKLSCIALLCHWSDTCRQRCEGNDFSCAAVASTSCYARSATSSAKLYHSADASNMDACAILYHSMSCAVLWNVFRWNHTVVSCLVVWCKSKSIDPCTVKTLSNRTPLQPCQVHGNQSMSRQTSPWRACHGMSQCAVYLHLSSCGQEVAGSHVRSVQGE